jgi:hypothetical protein
MVVLTGKRANVSRIANVVNERHPGKVCSTHSARRVGFDTAKSLPNLGPRISVRLSD